MASAYQRLIPLFTSVTDQIVTEKQFLKVQQLLQNQHVEFLKENKDRENKGDEQEGMISFPNIDKRRKDSGLKPIDSPPNKKVESGRTQFHLKVHLR